MRRTRLFTAALLASALAPITRTASAQATLRPNPSGRGIAEVVLNYPAGAAPAGATPVLLRVDYGQPHLRGRTMHTDSLVPYDRAWRAGANALTTFRTDTDITLGGVAVAKGIYAVFVLPTRTTWTLILQKNENQSATEYSTALDVARIPLRLTTRTDALESLTWWVIPSTAPGAARGELRFAWGREQLSADWVVR
jgi:hypothetical protein